MPVVTLLVISAKLEQPDLQRDVWMRWVLGVTCREWTVCVRLGQLCPGCAGLKQNQENPRFPLAAAQIDTIVTLMLSFLEIQDWPGSEGSKTPNSKSTSPEPHVPRPLERESIYCILEYFSWRVLEQ